MSMISQECLEGISLNLSQTYTFSEVYSVVHSFVDLFLLVFDLCREKVRFSLKGAQYRDKRFRIYRFLLEHFTDTQRFNITNKINQTILGERLCGLRSETKLESTHTCYL